MTVLLLLLVGESWCEEEEEDWEKRFARRVSWIPGADGAPFEVDDDGSEGLRVERLVVWDGCEAEGTMRRD